MTIAIEGRGKVVVHSITAGTVDAVKTAREHASSVYIRSCYDRISDVAITVGIESSPKNAPLNVVEIHVRHWLVALVLVIVVLRLWNSSVTVVR